MNKWIWFLPHVNGVIIGAILLEANGFDFNAVLGDWAFIAVVLALYSCLLIALPVSCRQSRTHRSRALTKTQIAYLNATTRLPH